MKTISVASVVLLVGATSLYAQNESLEKLVETEKAFASAAASTSVRQAFIKFFADEGVVFQQSAVNAKELWQSRPESPALLAWAPAWADISADGKLGYTTGDWNYRPGGIDDTPVAFGQYITIWKKQTDGEYKAVLDFGITHEKPDVVLTDWTSPESSDSNPKAQIDVNNPTLEFVSLAQFESSLAPQARLFRESKMPFIGKQAALKQIGIEQSDIASGRVSEAKYDGTDEMMYGYGVLELTKTDASVEKGNLMRIWRREGNDWLITLEVYAPVPAGND